MSSIQDSTSLPIILRNDKSGIAWDLWRGQGLPDPSSAEWHAIVSLFVDEKRPAQKGDKQNIVDFLMAKRSTFHFRLTHDIKRRFGASKLPEGARIYKPKRKTMMDSSEEAPTTSAAAVDEESSRPPAGAARPRLLALARRRGARRPPDGFCATVGRRRRRLSRRPAALPPS